MHEIWIRFPGTAEEATIAFDFIFLMVHEFMWPKEAEINMSPINMPEA